MVMERRYGVLYTTYRSGAFYFEVVNMLVKVALVRGGARAQCHSDGLCVARRVHAIKSSHWRRRSASLVLMASHGTRKLRREFCSFCCHYLLLYSLVRGVRVETTRRGLCLTPDAVVDPYVRGSSTTDDHYVHVAYEPKWVRMAVKLETVKRISAVAHYI